MVETSHMWLLGTWNVTSVTEKTEFYLINLNSNLSFPLWLVATILDSAALAALRGYELE